MKYVYMCLAVMVCYLSAQFVSGFAMSLLETAKYTARIMFNFGVACGVVLMIIQWHYDNKKGTTNDK